LVDSNGCVYVVGETYSPDFPSTPDAYANTKSDTTDMFISILDSTLSRLHMSTFTGGSGLDRWPGVLRDGSGNIYVLGYTESSDLATTFGAFDHGYNGGGDIYVAEFSFDPFVRITDIAPVTEAECAFGAFWADYDNDAYPDLFVTHWWESGSHLNALYHNNGDATFTEVGDQLPSQEGDALGATWGDYDNDGLEDLFVARPKLNSPGAQNILYHNSGDGTFTKVTTSPAATDEGFAVHTTFADFDTDGDLDLLIGNHNSPSGLSYYSNDGTGAFARLANGDIGLDNDDCGAITVVDYDGDGDVDLVHARNMLTTLCYTNDGDGTFTSVDNAVSTDSTRAFGWGDYDNDGDLDLCGGDSWPQGLVIYRNDGNGLFTRSLVDPADTSGTSMRQPYWVDYDSDGDLDLFVLKQGAAYAPAHPALYVNEGEGTFSEKKLSVIVMDSGSSSGAAWADYDRDGDLDVFIANTNSSLSAFYRNDIGSAKNWISIKCVGTQSNRSGVGAKIRVKAHIGGKDVRQLREISGQSGYFGQDEMRAHFGLGDAATIDSVQVEWPSGMIDVLTNVAVNQFLTVTESSCGDANGDTKINVGDAVFLISYIFRGGPTPNPLAAGNANCDGKINVGDAVYLISYIFRGGPAPCCP
ncbi:MAG: FG-GAP-like repeat-containing protein, partial [candidate division Zixibacteria bacterium]|nr:FG-GAP-like repeat-containing protein [candidate division Zixibacteria bacterium]